MGNLVGEEVGPELGSLLGAVLGEVVGPDVGRVVARCVGETLGAELGKALGFVVGTVVGVLLGFELARMLGLAEMKLGATLGEGLLLGKILGASVTVFGGTRENGDGVFCDEKSWQIPRFVIPTGPLVSI